MNLLRKQRDAVGLTIFSDKIESATKARSSSVHFKYLYTELEKMLTPVSVDEKKNTLAAETLHTIADNIHKRSLVVIFSDMFESRADTSELFSALQHLKHNKHEVILFHVVDHLHEIQFDYANRPYRFIDMETGQQVKVNPGEVKKKYSEQAKAFKDDLKFRCGQYHIDFVEADINKGFEQVLLPYLLKREKLY
jgi:uncharacterized protein (DUF58 family)